MATAKTATQHLVPRLTPSQVAESLGVDAGKVLSWINRKQLAAENVAQGTKGRPRWRIRLDDLEAFLAARRSGPAAAAPSRSRQPADVIKFF